MLRAKADIGKAIGSMGMEKKKELDMLQVQEQNIFWYGEFLY